MGTTMGWDEKKRREKETLEHLALWAHKQKRIVTQRRNTAIIFIGPLVGGVLSRYYDPMFFQKLHQLILHHRIHPVTLPINPLQRLPVLQHPFDLLLAHFLD